MSKKFASSVIILVLINVLVKFLWIFGVERGLQLKVGFENYGLYYSLFNFTAILSVISDSGLSNHLVRSVATDEQKQQSGTICDASLGKFDAVLWCVLNKV